MVDFKEIEKKWQERWEKERVFEGKVKKGKKVFLTVPYPYTSGPLHIGHGRTYTISDAWIRFKRLQGYNCLWPMAFHISGTPIIAISKKIESGDVKTNELFQDYVSIYEKDKTKVKKIVDSFIDPWNVAKFFANVMSQDFKRLGFSIDFTRQFTTGDKDYNKFIEWQFLKLRELGFIKKGEHPVQFCLNCMNAVGEDDIKDGDTLDTGIKTFTAIKFNSSEGAFLAATLRPETIFGLTNIWLNPEGDYVKAKTNNDVLVVSRTAAEKLKHHGIEVEVIKSFKGSELIGKTVSSPVEKRDVPVLPGNFVDTENGTGVVYSVPAHSIDDYVSLMEAKAKFKESKNVEPIQVIQLQNFGKTPAKDLVEKFGIRSSSERDKIEHATKILYKEEFYNGVLTKCGKFTGILVKDIKDSVKKWLKEQNKAFDFHDSNTPNLVCRDGGKVVVKVLKDQWFIDYGNTEWKKLAERALERMFIYPLKYKPVFEHTINWLHERACARKRGLGTQLPWDKEWVIDSLSDSTIYPAFYLLVCGIRKNKIDSEKLIPELFDFVFSSKGSLEELSKRTGIDKKIISNLKSEFEYWYPIDDRHTAIPHITNHLTFYIFNHVALFDEKLWPKSITLNELVIREGSKMSKSKGNVIPLAEVSEKYSSDLYRLYICSGADLDSSVDWTEKTVEMLRGRVSKFYELINNASKNKTSKEKPIDSWLESKFNTVIRDSKKMIDGFKLMEYTQFTFFSFLNHINRYFNKGGENYELLKNIFSKWSIMLSPIIPHLSEESWEILGNKGFVSLQHWPSLDPKKIDQKAEYSEDLVDKVLTDIKEVLTLIKIEKPKQVSIYVADDWKYSLFKYVKNQLEKTHNTGEILKEVMKDSEMKKHGKDVPGIVGNIVKDPSKIPETILNQKDELGILECSKSVFEK